MKSSRPPFFSGWACVALAVAMLLVPSVAGAGVDEVAASGQNENAEDCAQPGPCEDGEPSPPRAPVEESGSGCDEACRSLPTTSEGASAATGRSPVSASGVALGSAGSSSARRALRAVRPRAPWRTCAWLGPAPRHGWSVFSGSRRRRRGSGGMRCGGGGVLSIADKPSGSVRAAPLARHTVGASGQA